jgi:hypothetical protein
MKQDTFEVRHEPVRCRRRATQDVAVLGVSRSLHPPEAGYPQPQPKANV